MEIEGLRKFGHQVDVRYPRLRLGEFKFSRIPARRYTGYDIIHIHGPTPFLSDLTLLSNLGLPLVYTHYAEVCFLSASLSRTYTKLHRSLAAKASHVIVWTHDYARLFKGAATVIRPPVSFSSDEGPAAKRDRFTVVYVGQLRPFKGIDVMIRAARAVPEVDFWIVGDGWYKNTLMMRAAGCSNVTFLGPMYDDRQLASVYEQAHLIVLPSLNTMEAYGLVAIEGAIFGCVPVASDLLGVRENLAQLDGITFELGSDAELAAVIRDFQRNPGKWEESSERCRARAKEYAQRHTIESYAKNHLDVFLDVV
ncbi:MAG TPA: glycosyltransferase family 4 protein [Thermoplasmata archaeon]|nr:glycosyltransferase family 4 protein [Thermoplasmata archaeon]